MAGGDSNAIAYVWNLKNNKQFKLDSPKFGKLHCPVGDKYHEHCEWDSTGLISMPKDFDEIAHQETSAVGGIISLKFIDQNHYLRFTYETPYAILYDVTNPQPLKYLPLGKDPMPVMYYAYDEAIDTSPSAHILVTGIKNENGIIVYKYNPDNQTLNKIWVGKIGKH